MRKRRGGRGKGRRPSDEFSGTRPLWRGGVAAQTLEKKNRRGPRGRKAARARSATPARRKKKAGRLRGLERGRKMRAAAGQRGRFCAAAWRTAQPSLAKIIPSLSFSRSLSRSPDAPTLLYLPCVLFLCSQLMCFLSHSYRYLSRSSFPLSSL